MSLRVPNVDLAAGTLSLDPLPTKNDDPRVAVMPPVLRTLMQECVIGKNPGDYLFTRDGKPVLSFRGAWEHSCTDVGLGEMQARDYDGLLFHDLRRSACRNMDRRGMPRSVIMIIMGLATDAIYRRYRIVEHSDLSRAAELMGQPVQVPVQSDAVAPIINAKLLN